MILAISKSLPCVARFVVLVFFLSHISISRSAVTISEFLTCNGGGLPDEDMESPDWIEIYNSGPGGVNLGGWHLTDDAGDLTKWTFPATNLPAGGHLIVFASGKNRANAGWPLHANFQLDNDGEYLALVQPGGTVAHEYAPTYPDQRANVSYGLEVPTITTLLISSGATSRVLVPTSGALGTTWTTAAFNDAAWTATNTPASYSVGVTVGPLLTLDFNERITNAATVTQAGFTSLVINSNGSATASQSLPTTRIFGGLTVTVSNTAGFNYDDRLRTGPANSGAFTESLLLRDFVYSLDNSGTGGLDIGLAGLAANQSHRFTVWSYEGQATATPRVSDWFANGNLVKSNYTFTPGVSPISNDQYRFTFDAAANGSGAMLISGRREVASAAFSTAVYLNSLRVETLTPQAATNALGTLMLSNNATAYARVPFNVANPNAFENLKLRMRYDDGFVAYLNGRLRGPSAG